MPADAAPQGSDRSSAAQAQTEEVSGRALVGTNTLPSDPLFPDQWHLNNTGQGGGTPGVDINVTAVWADYDGSGVVVGVFDEGLQHSHPDLAANYNTTIDWDGEDDDDDPTPVGPEDNHGTAVAGIIAAVADNGIGGASVAPGATLAGFRGLGELGNFTRQVNVDVSNNSWGYNRRYDDDAASSDPFWVATFAAVENAADNGRGGLGTVWVWGAANQRAIGGDVNEHNLVNSRYSIAVAATDDEGLYSPDSSPGAALLISAPGAWLPGSIVTTDRTGADGFAAGDYIFDFNATSAAAPMVSGVVALMLEANPNLGWRDVQQILAYSARQTDPTSAGWQTNGATDWNGGGLHVSHDYGFGLVDARAAVRLAESWTEQSTSANEAGSSLFFAAPNLAIPDDDPTGVSSTIVVTEQIDIERVEVRVQIDHTWRGDLVVTLTSPDGTLSRLVDRPGVHGNDSFGDSEDDIRFNFTSAQHRGEGSLGTWTLEVSDNAGGDTGILEGWALRFRGVTPSDDDSYVYTDEYADFRSGSGRRRISDSGGDDLLNAAAVTGDSVLDLTPGARSSLAGNRLTIAEGTVIENAHAGDGDDVLRGNAAANSLLGGRGDDRLFGGTGADRLYGGRGDDRLFGGAGADQLNGGDGRDTASHVGAGAAITLDLANPAASRGEAAGDSYVSIEVFEGSGLADRLRGDAAANTLRGAGGADDLRGRAGGDLLFGDGGADQLRGAAGSDRLFGGAGDDSLYGGVGRDRLEGGGAVDQLYGQNGADSLFGGAGGDRLEGRGGADRIWGEAENDRLFGGDDADRLFGGAGSDRLFGNAGSDQLFGGVGDDRLSGQAGGDRLAGGIGAEQLYGGLGADRLFGQGGVDSLYGGAGDDRVFGGLGADTLSGGTGADRFVISALGDSAPGAVDLIEDFFRGQGDLIDLSAIDADSGTPGNQAFSFIFISDFSGTAGELRVGFGSGLVEGDVDGDSTADLEIEVLGYLEMFGTDFLL